MQKGWVKCLKCLPTGGDAVILLSFLIELKPTAIAQLDIDMKKPPHKSHNGLTYLL
jgi:hypothetical protein